MPKNQPMLPNSSCPAHQVHFCEWVVVERRRGVVSRFADDLRAAKAEALRLNNVGRDPGDHFYVAHNEISAPETRGEWQGPLADIKREHERFLHSLSPQEVEQYV